MREMHAHFCDPILQAYPSFKTLYVPVSRTIRPACVCAQRM
jgi:hypothetical protein